MQNRNFFIQVLLSLLLANLAYTLYYSYFGSSGELAVLESMPQSVVATKATGSSSKDRYVQVKNDKMVMMIDTVGGRVARVDILGYGEDNGPVRFLDVDKSGFLDAQSGYSGDKGLVFSPSKKSVTVEKGETYTLRLTATGSNDVQYVKSYTISGDNYVVSVENSALNRSDKAVQVRPYYAFSGDKLTNLTDAKAPSSSNVNFDSLGSDKLGPTRAYSGISYKTAKKPYVRMKFNKMASAKAAPSNVRDGWLAFQKHYYISTWVMPKDKNFRITNHWRDGESVEGSEVYEQYFVTQAVGAPETIKPGGKASSVSSFYTGPQVKKDLMALSPSLKLTMDYGFFWMIGNGLFSLLDFVHNFVPNWGYCVMIVITLLKLVMYPSSRNQQIQARLLKKIQPEKAIIEKKYEGQGFSIEKHKEIDALFKRNNVKMGLGSFFLSIATLPLMIAFMSMLSVSVEFVNAPLWWISDLSSPDPSYILAAASVLSVLLVSSETQTSDDLKLVMTILPLIMAFMVIKMPAVLQLYLASSQLLGYAQMVHLKNNS